MASFNSFPRTAAKTEITIEANTGIIPIMTKPGASSNSAIRKTNGIINPYTTLKAAAQSLIFFRHLTDNLENA